MSLVVFRQLCYMMVIAALSFVFSRRNEFGAVHSGFASRLLLYFVNPCLILRSFIVPYSQKRMRALVLSVAVSIVMHFAFTAIAMVAVRRHKGLTHKEEPLAGLDRIAIVFTNCGFIGIPLINGALGSEAVFYLMGYIATFNVYIWIFGAHEVGALTNAMKVLTNPNVLAVIAGVLLFCLPWQLPAAVRRPLDYIGEANTALSMILLGMLFAQFVKMPHEHMKGTYRRAAFVGALRMAAAGVVAVAITVASWHLVPHSEVVRMALVTCCIAALCPIGMSVSTFACVFCADEQGKGISPAAYSSVLVLSTSAAGVVTIPLFVRLTEMFM